MRLFPIYVCMLLWPHISFQTHLQCKQGEPVYDARRTCILAVYDMMGYPNFNKPSELNRETILPLVWGRPFCKIILDVIDIGASDTFPLRDLLQTTYNIIERCISHPPHLGGREVVGPKQVLWLRVEFFPSRPDVKDPLGNTTTDDVTVAQNTTLPSAETE